MPYKDLEKRKESNRKAKKKFREKNIDKDRKYQRDAQRRRRQKDPEQCNEYNRTWNKNNKDKAFKTNRKSVLKIKYGISIDDYNELLSKQNNVCAICKKEEMIIDPRSQTKRQLAVDHCHVTGKVRGLLCSRCNIAIGYFNDNVLLIKEAIEYLTK